MKRGGLFFIVIFSIVFSAVLVFGSDTPYQRIPLGEMGYFDGAGQWHWNPEFWYQCDGACGCATKIIDGAEVTHRWGPYCPGDETTGSAWIPYMEYIVTNAMMEYRQIEEQTPYSRLSMDIAEGVPFPICWWNPGDPSVGGQPGIACWFMPPPGCENPPDGPNCENPWTDPVMEPAGYTRTPRSRIARLEAFGGSDSMMAYGNELVDLTSATLPVAYDYGPGRTNLWRIKNPWYDWSVYFKNFPGHKPLSGQVYTLRAILTDGTEFSGSAGPFDFDIPVPYTTVNANMGVTNRKGKVIETGNVVSNIKVSEDEQKNLIIQWGEPVVTLGGVQLLVFIEELWNPSPDIYYHYIRVEAPPQTGTVVIPKAVITEFRSMTSADSVRIRIIYRVDRNAVIKTRFSDYVNYTFAP